MIDTEHSQSNEKTNKYKFSLLLLWMEYLNGPSDLILCLESFHGPYHILESLTILYFQSIFVRCRVRILKCFVSLRHRPKRLSPLSSTFLSLRTCPCCTILTSVIPYRLRFSLTILDMTFTPVLLSVRLGTYGRIPRS